jgi:hypothetical protein
MSRKSYLPQDANSASVVLMQDTSLETIAPLSDDPIVKLPPLAAA